jgi:serine/threonine protein kinase
MATCTIDEQFCHLVEYSLKNVVTTHRQIGNGAYGSIEEVMVDGVVCVAKVLFRVYAYDYGPTVVYSNKVERIKERFARQCTVMSKLRHPNIVQFLGVYFPLFYSADLPGPQRVLPWLIMEYLPYTLDLVLEWKRLNIPIHVKVSFLLDITKGLLYLHNKEIYHRNLTARHVLITSSMVAKIAGFDMARMVTESSASNKFDLALTTLPGNMLYMPPEADQERIGGNVTYNNTIDIFSFGVIVLFTITQTFPCNLLSSTYPDPDRPGAIRGRTEVERREKYFEIAEGSLKTDENQRLIKISQHCLQNDPRSRPKAEVVLDELTYLAANKRLNGSTEIWKKDKLQLVELLDEKQKEFDEIQHKVKSQSVSTCSYDCIGHGEGGK